MVAMNSVPKIDLAKCILCNRDAVVGAMFSPTDSELCKTLRVPPQKTRVFFYGLCAKCLANPHHPREVEKKLLELMNSEQTENRD